MKKIGSAEPKLEDLFESKKPVKNPLVPLGNFILLFSMKPLNCYLT